MNITIILPIFNEEEIIKKSIQTVIAKLSRFCTDVELIAVDDGSTDTTPIILRTLKQKDDRIKIVTHKENKGYGAALRSGVKYTSYRWIFFTDADLQFDVNNLRLFMKQTKDYDFIVGHRKQRADSLRRKIISKTYNKIVRILFGLKLTDVDCAFKLMKKSSVQEINFSSNSFFVSVELMVKAYRMNYKILEIGVTHLPRLKGISKVTMKQVFFTLKDLSRLYKSLI